MLRFLNFKINGALMEYYSLEVDSARGYRANRFLARLAMVYKYRIES
jgi:hypothetical protein